MKEPQKTFLVHRRTKPGPKTLIGGATGKDDIHALGEQYNGIKSGRGLSVSQPKDVHLRVTLAYELVYDDVTFLSPDDFDKYGIPDIFGEDQLVFYERRIRGKIIICHKLNIMQIEARQ